MRLEDGELVVVDVERPCDVDALVDTLRELVVAKGTRHLAGEVPMGAEREAKAWAGRRERRRPTLDEDHYAEIARVYSDAAHRGSRPRQAVAKPMFTSGTTASRWIGEARRRGLLPATTPGRARAMSSEEQR